MGRSLVQLARANFDLDADQAHALDIAERYLGIAHASHSLGHRHLQPSLAKRSKRPRLECGPCPEDCPHLIELLEIFGSVNHLYQTPFWEQSPPPWAANSEFRALQDELEEYLLRHPVTFRFGSNSPPADGDAKRRRRGDLDASISSLVWHCCAIALNRAFLLVPERPPRSGATPRDQHDPVALVDEFPDAPSLFLRERVHRCESSADAICSISRDVIRNGGFYSVSTCSLLIHVCQPNIMPLPTARRTRWLCLHPECIGIHSPASWIVQATTSPRHWKPEAFVHRAGGCSQLLCSSKGLGRSSLSFIFISKTRLT